MTTPNFQIAIEAASKAAKELAQYACHDPEDILWDRVQQLRCMIQDTLSNLEEELTRRDKN